MLPVETPYKTYTGLDGKPLDGGYVYFGLPNQDPITAPISVYWDAAGTLPASQPLRTSNGYILRSGTPANVFCNVAYSELVQDVNHVQVFYAGDSSEFSPSTYLASSTGTSLIKGTWFGNVVAPVSSLASYLGSSLIGFKNTCTGALQRSVQSKLGDFVSVLDFGADPTGVADSTAAFNLATQATAAWSTALRYNILVPAGKYKINGTVYVRKGQTLSGSGHGSYIDATGMIGIAADTFVLGKGLIAGVPTDDAGGEAVKICNLNTLGGSGTNAVVATNAAGFSIDSMFMTGPGTGISITGADGLISNIEIDQCLNAITLSGAQNIAIKNFNIYLPNYGFTLGGACRDITISNGIIEYTKYSSVYFSDGSSEMHSICFANIDFLMNEQFATFSGFIYSRATNVDAQFTGCSFRNWYNHAIKQDAGTGVRLTFTGCVFDGNKTAAPYAQSTTAKVLYTGYGSYIFTGCEFRNLPAEIATVNNNITLLKITGGAVVNCPRTRLNIAASDAPTISIRDVSGFALVETSGANMMVVLPYWAMSPGWRVAIKGNTSSGSNANYLAVEEAIYSAMWQFDGTGSIFADKTLVWKTPTRAIPADLAAVVCFGTAPGGLTRNNTYSASGTLCISVPVASAYAFDFSVETVL